MAIIDHISLNVTDYARAKKFYAAALAPLGIELMMEFGEVGGFGRDGKPDLWIAVRPSAGEGSAPLSSVTPVHLAFSARSRAEVDAFHKAALAAGAKDNGAPGLRPNYHPNYYGAFAIDPDGHNIEAVTHGPA
jgi:catechol 2,3-dioxygenase-like lactoylglutathione lyase family enzyme